MNERGFDEQDREREAETRRRLQRQYERDREPRRSCGNRIAIPNCVRVVVRWPC